MLLLSGKPLIRARGGVPFRCRRTTEENAITIRVLRGPLLGGLVFGRWPSDSLRTDSAAEEAGFELVWAFPVK